MTYIRNWEQRTLMKIVLFMLYFVHHLNGFRVVNNRQYDRKPRYYTTAQLAKVHRFLQRRYAIAQQNGTSDDKHSYYTNSWAVHIFPPEKQVADRVAEKHGFINIGPVSNSW